MAERAVTMAIMESLTSGLQAVELCSGVFLTRPCCRASKVLARLLPGLARCGVGENGPKYGQADDVEGESPTMEASKYRVAKLRNYVID